MSTLHTQLTRRQVLRAAGAGAGTLGLAATFGSKAFGSASPSPASTPTTGVPDLRTRPDLRLPALQVTTRPAVAAPGFIFLAPYNAPRPAQAGAMIVDGKLARSARDRPPRRL